MQFRSRYSPDRRGLMPKRKGANSVDRTICVMRGARIFTVKPWPANIPNPNKYRWAIWRDGVLICGERLKADAVRGVHSGRYDACPAAKGA
jgi:hypothetical protein